MNPENEVVVRPVPEGWNSIHENVHGGGLIYTYPDGRPDHVMSRDELLVSVWGEGWRDHQTASR